MSKLAIVGGGFMGGALAEGLLDAGWHRDSFVVADISADRREHLTERLKVRTTESAAAAVEAAGTVLVAVKPQGVDALLAQIGPHWRPDQLAISICAGIPIAVFEEALGQVPVIRNHAEHAGGRGDGGDRDRARTARDRSAPGDGAQRAVGRRTGRRGRRVADGRGDRGLGGPAPPTSSTWPRPSSRRRWPRGSTASRRTCSSTRPSWAPPTCSSTTRRGPRSCAAG